MRTHRKRYNAGSATPDHSHALVREILLVVARQRSAVDAQACETLFALIEKLRDMRRRLLTRLSKLRLSEGKFFTLVILYHHQQEVSTPSALAHHAGVSRASMTGILDEMERTKWISRQRSSSDGRKSGVKLTSDGILIAKKAIDSLMTTTTELVKELKQESLPSLLQRLGPLPARSVHRAGDESR